MLIVFTRRVLIFVHVLKFLTQKCIQFQYEHIKSCSINTILVMFLYILPCFSTVIYIDALFQLLYSTLHFMEITGVQCCNCER